MLSKHSQIDTKPNDSPLEKLLTHLLSILTPIAISTHSNWTLFCMIIGQNGSYSMDTHPNCSFKLKFNTFEIAIGGNINLKLTISNKCEWVGITIGVSIQWEWFGRAIGVSICWELDNLWKQFVLFSFEKNLISIREYSRIVRE